VIADVLDGAARWHVEQGDALAVLRALPDASVDAVVTDPPYYRVKADWWDRQWDTPTGFLAWIDRLVEQWERVLKPNGSLFCFASPQMASRVEVKIAERMRVLNRIVWRKQEGRHLSACKADLRAFFPASESIIFAEVRGSDAIAKGEAGYVAKCDELRGFVFEPLRAYLDGERARAGVSLASLHAAWCAARGTKGHMVGHWFGRSQWALPTSANYEWLRERLGGDFLRREYEALRREYEALRREYEALRREYEALRRPFNVTADVPYTDVWDFATVPHRPGKHGCEKPAALIRHIIRSATRPDAVVLDSFSGSGVVGEVCVEEGRRFVGSEIEAAWADRARFRIGAASPGVHREALPPARERAGERQPAARREFGQLSLLTG
jgi:adenine-specific DNA-methyltransferase